ncbi:MAG: PAS domain-containing protein, partial [Pseudomonadota bacterium]
MHTQITSVFSDRRHYLERELDEMMQNNPIWQSLREGSLDGIWYRDLERPNNEWVSPEFWRLLGFDPAEKKHTPDAWMDLIFREDLSKATANFRAHCENPTHPYDQILRYRHANGSTIWVRCRGVAIRNTDGKPVRMLGTHSDVTTLKRAEEAAIAENGITSDANEELKAFAYSTSHDLKSPANTIRMLLEEARRALNTGDVTDAKDMLAKAETTNDAMRGGVGERF